MKTIYEILIVIILNTGCAMENIAQPAWNVDPHAFEFSMTITAKINSDGDFSEDVNDRVAAFVDGECHGVTNIIYDSSADGYYLYLLVYGNKPAETVTFKIYDAGNNEICNAKRSTIFVINGIVGSLDSPFIISSEKLNDKAELTDFTIPGQIGETLLSEKNLYLQKSPESNFNGIIPSFSVSEGAKVFVNGIRQESGMSMNDFSNPVLYTVISADFTDTTDYVVFVSANITAMNFVEDKKLGFNVYPNPFSEILYIESPPNLHDIYANIYTANGILIKTQSINDQVLNIIYTDSLTPGIFFITFTNSSYSECIKVIKKYANN